jgi:hypothetical protein
MLFAVIFAMISIFSCYAGENDSLIQAFELAQKENSQKTKIAFALQITKGLCYVAQQFENNSYRTDLFTCQDNNNPVLKNHNTSAEEFQRMQELKSNIEQGTIGSIGFTVRVIELPQEIQKNLTKQP